LGAVRGAALYGHQLPSPGGQRPEKTTGFFRLFRTRGKKKKIRANQRSWKTHLPAVGLWCHSSGRRGKGGPQIGWGHVGAGRAMGGNGGIGRTRVFPGSKKTPPGSAYIRRYFPGGVGSVSFATRVSNGPHHPDAGPRPPAGARAGEDRRRNWLRPRILPVGRRGFVEGSGRGGTDRRLRGLLFHARALGGGTSYHPAPNCSGRPSGGRPRMKFSSGPLIRGAGFRASSEGHGPAFAVLTPAGALSRHSGFPGRHGYPKTILKGRWVR